MATGDILVVKSSPSFSECQAAAMSSSPIFPSPRSLLKYMPRLKPESRAELIPENTRRPITSEANPMADDVFVGPRDINVTSKPTGAATMAEEGRKPSKSKSLKRPTLRKRLPSEDAEGRDQLNGPQKPRAKKVQAKASDGVTAKEKPPRKPRAKKDVNEGQTTIPKGRVTKASSGSRAEKPVGKKSTGTVSSHFSCVAPGSIKASDIPKNSANDLLLQEAVKRRINWTPPKATEGWSSAKIRPADDCMVASERSSASGENQKRITDLFRGFGYSNGTDIATPEKTMDQIGMRKRKLIELVNTNIPVRKPAVAKVKAVKKKPRTITGLAISAYAVDNSEELDLSSTRLLEHSSRTGLLLEENGVGTTDGLKPPPKPRSKNPVKTSRASKSKKGTAHAPILLSPQTALKQVKKQEFVFGTCSQLAREDSPTLLRDLQQALQESNQLEENSFADMVGTLSPLTSPSAAERGTGIYVAKRNLWGAASKVVEGRLVDVETLDLSGPPQVSMLPQQSGPVSSRPETLSDTTKLSVNDGWYNVDEDEQSEKENMSVMVESSETTGVKAAIQVDLPNNSTCTNVIETSPSKANSLSMKSHTKVNVPSKYTLTLQKPDYGSYTTVQLAEEVASYHFKPVKKRDQMIALLERCWEGKQNVVLGNQAANELPISRPFKPTSDSNKPLVLRQTPKKQKKKTSVIPEEIDDSETPLTPSPQPRRAAQVHTPPLALQPSVSQELDESLILTPTAQQLHLHKHITRAVTTAPPSTDPKNPNWYEKMLMYDPIVLEDLAAWLNTGALEKAGWDGEVGPFEVKKWCMEKSVCCLWRENLRGQSRKRV